MIIYLAGKIGKNDWRHSTVDGLSDTCKKFYDNPEMEWPILEQSIENDHSYSGPYFISCSEACYGHGTGWAHGPGTHGYDANPGTGDYIDIDDCGIECEYKRYMKEQSDRKALVSKRCMEAIERSDIVFAWIDDLTAFGTIFELGYATAKHIPVYLAMDKKNRGLINQNIWITICGIKTVENSRFTHFDDVYQAFGDLLSYLDVGAYNARLAKIESPIELKFFEAMQNNTDEQLEPQWKVEAGGHHYRLDFAIPSKMIAFELDGHDYHKTREQRTSDTRRERNLQKEGWKVIRFTGTDIHNNLDKCVADACQLIATGV
jgi:very-short-patch-repair endonuclease